MTTFTSNAGFVVDPTGSNVGTWADNVTNPDFVAIDGMLSGVQTISVSNVPITLTSPAGFTPTPGAGPTQSQNRVLRFTGTLSADVRITLPIPGVYVIQNLTSPNAFTLSFQGVTATEVIAVPPGSAYEIYNDGANVRFINIGLTASLMLYGTVSSTPSWISACTVKPYLLCDGTVYNISDYPILGVILGSAFGGNGLTTFAVPDLRGRVPLSYDGTGTRITVAGCGINGQALGAAIDHQTNTLVAANLPPYTPAGAVATTGSISGMTTGQVGSGSANTAYIASTGTTAVTTLTSTFTGTAAPGQISTPVNNVQPSQVVGSWMIRT